MLETEEDKSKFERLYTKFKQDMYYVAFDILKNKEDAEDAVHQSFLKIAEKFTKISSISRNEIKAYIVIISRNTAINLYRKNKDHAERCAELTEDISDNADQFFEQAEQSDLVDAIKSLPQMYKDVLFLFYLQEFSAKETAQMLYITENTVRQRALRAKQMIKKILEEGENYGK